MEFIAVAKEGVSVYAFRAGEEPRLVRGFPAVRTADGCAWSADGSLLGLETGAGGVAVYNAAAEYAQLCEVPPLLGGPVRNFYFSPLAKHLVTYERHTKDGGSNVGVWDARTGEPRFAFVLKTLTEMTWPPLKWTSLETHCCRMVQDGVMVMAGGMQKEAPTGKIAAPGIMAFEVAPRGAGTGPPHVAICIAESKGAPARCQIFKLTDLAAPTASKTFFKAQTVTMQWNNTGTSLLVRTSMEVDDTGKSYYGGSHLHFMRADGQESAIIASPDGGPIHDVQWSPTQDEFCLLHGVLPCNLTLHEGKKGQKKMDFGTGHRNTIRWNNFGRFLVLAGHGQLMEDHPGGASSILLLAGQDATEDFEAVHSKKAWLQLEDYFIGPLRGAAATVPVASAAATAQVSAPVPAAAAGFLQKKAQALPLVEKIMVSHDTRIFRFGLPTPNTRLGLPTGMHMLLTAKVDGKTVMRPYTPMTDDTALGHVDLLVKVYFAGVHPRFPEGGKMSQHLDSMKIGDTIDVKGPLGEFVYRSLGAFSWKGKPRQCRRISLVAGGTGLTPCYQVLAAVLRDPQDATEIRLLYANRTPEDILLRQELDALAAAHPDRFQLWYTVDLVPEGIDWAYDVGFVTQAMLEARLFPATDGTISLMCGPEPMTRSATDKLLQLGYKQDDVLVA